MSDPRPAGLSHLTFVVSDLDAMEEILTTVLGARRVYDSGDESFSVSEERFFLVGENDVWIATMQGEPLSARSYNHVAFRVADDDLEAYRERVTALGLEIPEGRPRVAGEGRSLYFYDRDNHLFELHSGTLAERLARYATGRDAKPENQTA